MKKYYSLVISVFDKNGNRVDAHEVTGSNDKRKIWIAREEIDKEIANGKYDDLNRENCTLDSDIEVHDDVTWELLYIM